MQANEYQYVYQFKIAFSVIKPAIWRQFQMAETATFWELNVVLQDMLGWSNSAMHEFYAQNINTTKATRIALFDEGWDNLPMAFTWEAKIAAYFNETRNVGYYHYPLGNEWQCQIDFEGIHPCDETQTYPLCLGGERRAPPEACHGVEEYQEWLRVMKNPRDLKYNEMVKRFGKPDDVDAFDSAAVQFSDPAPQLKRFCPETSCCEQD